MNIVDIIIVLIVVVGVWIGAMKGLIKMLLSLGSTLAAIVVAFFLQPIVSSVLKEHTGLFDLIKSKISENFNLVEMPLSDMKVIGEKSGVEAVLKDLEKIGVDKLSNVAMQIASFLITFIVVVVVFLAITFILSGIGKLPVIKEVNKFAGAIIGGVVAVVLVWIGMLFLTYWFSTGQQKEILTLIQKSMIAKYIYQFNLIEYILSLVHYWKDLTNTK